MKTNRLRVVLVEKVEGMDNGISVAKESEDKLLLLFRHLREALLGYLFVFLNQCFGDDNLLYAVLSWILKHLFTHHIGLADGCSHLKSRIYAYSIDPIKHLRVHSSH